MSTASNPRDADPTFEPVRPVMAANVRRPERDVDVPLMSDLLTARITDLFNVGYEILLQVFQRFSSRTPTRQMNSCRCSRTPQSD